MQRQAEKQNPVLKKKSALSLPIALWGLLILLALSPLPYGSNRPLPETLIVVFTAAIGFAWAIGQKRRAKLRGDTRPLKLPLPALSAALFVAVLTYIAVQALAPLPAPLAHPIWAEAGTISGYISIDPATSLGRLPLLASYGLLCLIAALLSRHYDRLRTLTQGLLLIGGLYLVAAFLNFSALPIFSFLGDFAVNAPVPAAPFRNRNSFATFSGMMATGGLIVMIWTMLRNQRAGTDTKQMLADALTEKTLPVLFGLTLFIGGMTMVLLTQSRAGFIATLVAIFAIAVLAPLRQPAHFNNPLEKPKRRFPALRIAALFGIVLSGVAGLFAFSGAGLETRLNEATDTVRAQLYTRSADMIASRPVLGSGYATFTENFAISRTNADQDLGSFVNKAHSTYLELATELGLPATLALLLAQVLLVLRCVKPARQGGRAAIPAAIAVAWAVLLGVHTAVDFSAQIPAVAMFYAVMLGIGQGSAEIVQRRK